MPRIRLLKPLDQPFGVQRSLRWIVEALRSHTFDRLRLIVAFAKEGPLLRLASDIQGFRQGGGNVEAVFGVDQLGTSIQALQFALVNFNRSFVWHHPSLQTTFHPKIYLFEGRTQGAVLFGSGNLTVGGLETNCEAGMWANYDLLSEQEAWAEVISCWTELVHHPNSVPLDHELIARLRMQKLIVDEGGARQGDRARILKVAGTPEQQQFPFTPLKPPSSRPGGPRKRTARVKRPETQERAAAAITTPGPSLPIALVIQITPHHNGEIFLSKRAVSQNPEFFGFPFEGLTAPKKSGNPPYPQRTPDPLTDWRVFDRNGKVVYVLESFRLNTVSYERKGEIRITVPPEFGRKIPPQSILHIQRPPAPSLLDYVCDVFLPGSTQYELLLAACIEVMPSGGRKVPRRFGWL